MKIFLDTETNGFKPGQIAQLSYIKTDDNLKILGAENYFYAVDSMPEQVAQVHGFTKERLYQLSGGRQFKDSAEAVYKDMSHNEFICHNVGFDEQFMIAELVRAGFKFVPSSKFCTMQHYTPICKLPGRFGKPKWPKLEELMRFLEIAPEKALDLARQVYGSGEIGFHDARFDTAGLFLCYEKGIRTGVIAH